MMIIMEHGASQQMVDKIAAIVHENGCTTRLVPLEEEQVAINVLGVDGVRSSMLETVIGAEQGVQDIRLVSDKYRIASKKFIEDRTLTIERNVHGAKVSVTFNGENVIMMAGPCAVENEDQMNRTAALLSSLGVRVMRGGAYKPRTSPYEFQGLGEDGLRMARAAADRYGLLYITEVVDVADLDTAAKYADILQIGTRNMQNYKLLEAAGKLDMPVLLKRGFNAKLDELLLSAEYILCQQKHHQVILCLRGIRTFENETRNTVDLGTLPLLKQMSWLPVVVDPSHASGRRSLVNPFTQMAIAGGADGFLIEMHPFPEKAQCDGAQSMRFREFGDLYDQAASLCRYVGRQLI